MDYPISCELIFTYEDPYEAEISFRSLNPEIKMAKSVRSNIQLAREGNILKIHVKAKDLTVLRSMINTYIRWVSVIEKTKRIGGDK